MAEESKVDLHISLVIVGDDQSSVKDLFCSFVNEPVPNNPCSVEAGQYVARKNILLDDQRICLEIGLLTSGGNWETLTKFKQSLLQGSIYGAVIVHDTSESMSFDTLEDWIRKLRTEVRSDIKITFVMIKGKNASENIVNYELGKELADSFNVNFIKADSNTNDDVQQLLITIINNMMYDIPKLSGEMSTGSPYVNKEAESKGQRGLFNRLLNPVVGILGALQGMSKSIPDELEPDPYTLELYEKALKDGTEKDQSIRVNVVGNYRQGKTSLTKRLLGNKMRDIRSTNGIEIGRYTCHKTQNGKYSYRKVDDKSFDIVGRLVSVALSKETDGKQGDDDQELLQLSLSQSLKQATASNLDLRKQQVGCSKPERTACTYDRQTSVDGKSTTLRSTTNSSHEKIEKTRKATVRSDQEIYSFTKALHKKSAKSDTHSQTAFDVWDFGGQYIFYATHTIFHSRRAIYLLVFDLSLDLKHIVVDEEFPTESGNRSMEYFLQFWMQSIHSFVGTADGRQPKVILVGTHKDKVKGNLEQKQRYVKNYFDDIKKLFDGTVLLNHLHPEVFAIDNTDPKDMSMALLRETITKIAEDETCVLEVPAKWIHLEKNMKERMHMKILSMKFIMAIDSENEYPLGDLDQVKLFLRYHHVKGTFVYFDEEPISEYVVLDPQYLVDAFKSIITSERFCSLDKELRQVWKKLMTEARLEKCLIERQWGQPNNKAKLFLQYKDILLAFLTKHHVISEATTFDETSKTSSGLGWYIVPSLLRDQSNESELQEFLQGKQQALVTIVMSFENHQIVATIFHRYIAALMAKWSNVCTSGKPLLFSDLCVVRLDVMHAGIAKHRLNVIELSIVSLCPSLQVQSTQADLFRRFSEAVIFHEFGKLRDSIEGFRPYTLEFRCNHESHCGNGSNNTESISSLDDSKIIPCPDLMAHDLNAIDAKAEWFGGFRDADTIPNLRLNDKLISKISHCIGENWQILGHELDLTHVQIEHICEDHPNNTLMKIYHMLKKWCHKMSKKATLDVLVQAMRNCPTLSVQWDGIRNIIDGII